MISNTDILYALADIINLESYNDYPQSATNNALMATGASIPFLGALANLRRRTLNIGRKLLGKPIVPQEALKFKPSVRAPLGKELGIVGKAKLSIARGTQRALNFGGKLLGVFNKLYYVAEGVFDFADYKKRGNSNFQAFIGSATRGITKYLTFGAGMKAGALALSFLGSVNSPVLASTNTSLPSNENTIDMELLSLYLGLIILPDLLFLTAPN